MSRGGDGRLMPWGDEWSGAEANFCGSECPSGSDEDPDDGYPGPAPIGALGAPGPFGLVDAAGNLWEWSGDGFDVYSHRHADGTRDPYVPVEPETRRFLRGGSYASFAGILERRTGEGVFDTDIPTRGARCVYDFGTAHRSIVEER